VEGSGHDILLGIIPAFVLERHRRTVNIRVAGLCDFPNTKQEWSNHYTATFSKIYTQQEDVIVFAV
jgi:hypothetical protein